MSKLVLGLSFSVFFLLVPCAFAQSGGVLVSPPPQADDDDSSTEVLDAPDQGNPNGPGHHRHHKHQHADVDSGGQNADLYLFGGEYDGGSDAHNYSHRGSESRGAAHSGGSTGKARSKDDGKKGEKQ